MGSGLRTRAGRPELCRATPGPRSTGLRQSSLPPGALGLSKAPEQPRDLGGALSHVRRAGPKEQEQQKPGGHRPAVGKPKGNAVGGDEG